LFRSQKNDDDINRTVFFWALLVDEAGEKRQATFLYPSDQYGRIEKGKIYIFKGGKIQKPKESIKHEIWEIKFEWNCEITPVHGQFLMPGAPPDRPKTLRDLRIRSVIGSFIVFYGVIESVEVVIETRSERKEKFVQYFLEDFSTTQFKIKVIRHFRGEISEESLYQRGTVLKCKNFILKEEREELYLTPGCFGEFIADPENEDLADELHQWWLTKEIN
jgi:hypothetical protein